MTLKDKLSRVLLILLVAFSLILSYLIWMRPITSDPETETVSTNVTQRSLKAATEVFLPAKAIWHQEDQKLLSVSENLLSLLQAELIKGDFGTLEQVGNDEQYFQEVLATQDALELDYIGHFLLGEYVDVYSLDLNYGNENYQKITFDRIVIDFAKNKFFALNDDTHAVYSADLEISSVKIKSLLKNDELHFLPVTIGHPVLQETYYVDEDFSLPKYSYILGSQPYTTFTSAFFQDPDDLSINDSGDDLLYGNEQGENLTINNETGQVVFTTDDRNPAVVGDNLYKKSFDYVASLGVTLGNLRYFDEGSATLTFKTFVEGYPLFSDHVRGQLEINFSGDSLAQIMTNVQTIQIPVPSDEEVQLVKTETVLSEITEAGGDVTQITNLQIGYGWKDLKETSQVVDLMPEWFVQYDHQWVSLSQLMTQLEGDD
ncbi:YycH family regulatory protein [Enterococcus timonensis]|uniref:YycH family regulatory protein n=1 Tax=Enterococcus timonensis TaxID=1852364 RepID=UPI0008D9A4D9|nr:two-component system activity regulator YycH [Enterococcus timonensis]